MYRCTKDKSPSSEGITGVGMQYFSRSVIPGGYSRGVSLQESSSPWLASLAAFAKETLEHVKNKSALTGLCRRLTSVSCPTNSHQENPQLNKGKYRGTDGSVSWRGYKNPWLLRWAESKTHLELLLWKGSHSVVLQIKLGCTAIGVSRAVARAVFGISPRPQWLESELQDGKEIRDVWHEVHNQGSRAPPVVYVQTL